MENVGIIPARYASSRFEGKPLADILGKPMVQHVYERASRATLLSQVIVATDDKRIYEVVKNFGGNVLMTGECRTGTDRVTVVAQKLTCDIVVNVQGDEPLLEPEQIDLMLQPFIHKPSVQVCTLKERIRNVEDYLDPNVVKVVTNLKGDALYFSRTAIPSKPNFADPDRQQQNKDYPDIPIYRHIGLYAYRKKHLLDFASWERTPNEIAEGLEQLRFLEHGVPIHVVETDVPIIGVDVPADLEKVKQLLQATI